MRVEIGNRLALDVMARLRVRTKRYYLQNATAAALVAYEDLNHMCRYPGTFRHRHYEKRKRRGIFTLHLTPYTLNLSE